MHFMTMFDWNRKDADPNDTIARIEKILNTINIPTKFVAEYNYKGLWFSNRVEIDGIPFIGANGKGVSNEYAKASALGEFMERLQSGFLLNNLFTNKINQINNQYKCNDDWISCVTCTKKINFENYVKEMSGKLKETNAIELFDIINDEKVWIPSQYIDMMCSTTGLSSGNTFNEAFCQGLCEIFERYVVRYIYYGDYNEQLFCHLKESVYEDLQSYKMIQAIQDKGYKVYVIDCTLNNKIPVLGILLIDSSKTKYLFKLASDINIDICLQRCITEIFQGCTFDVNFRMSMIPFQTENKCDNFWNNLDTDYEYTKFIVNGTGRLPNRFLMQIMSVSDDVMVFRMEKLSNEQAAHQLLSIANRLSSKIYISNLTQFGFPTLRIFIPYYSECFYFENNNVVKIIELKDQIKNSFCHNKPINKDIFLKIIKLSQINPYTYKFNLSKLIGIMLNDYDMYEYMYDVNLLIALLACYYDEGEIAEQYIRLYSESGRLSYRQSFLTESCISAISSKVNCEEFVRFMQIFTQEQQDIQRIKKFYRNALNGFSDIHCTECKKCTFLHRCQYPMIKQIAESMRKKCTMTLEDEFFDFLRSL